jgi:hypothetical protein
MPAPQPQHELLQDVGLYFITATVCSGREAARVQATRHVYRCAARTGAFRRATTAICLDILLTADSLGMVGYENVMPDDG